MLPAGSPPRDHDQEKSCPARSRPSRCQRRTSTEIQDSEPPDDPLILFSALYGFWNAVPFNGDVCRGLAAQFLALAAKEQTTAFDEGLALYNAAEHRPLATPVRDGASTGVRPSSRLSGMALAKLSKKRYDAEDERFDKKPGCQARSIRGVTL
jgi:hypothetical protein